MDGASSKNFKKTKTHDEVKEALQHFVGTDSEVYVSSVSELVVFWMDMAHWSCGSLIIHVPLQLSCEVEFNLKICCPLTSRDNVSWWKKIFFFFTRKITW